MSKRDFTILLAVILLGMFIGWGAKSCSTEPQIKPLDESKYIKAVDSVKTLLKASQDSILVFRQHISHTDSLVIINRKKLRYDNELIKNFTPTGRERYMDSLFKSAGL